MAQRTAGYRGDIKILAPANRTQPEAVRLCDAWGVEIVDWSQLGLGYNATIVPHHLMGERFNMYHVPTREKKKKHWTYSD